MGVAKGSDFRTVGLPNWIKARADGVVVALHVQPGARRTAIAGPHGDRLKVAVSSPPEDGRANAALLEFLSERLTVPKSSFQLLAGLSSREKRIAIVTRLSPAAVVELLTGSGQ